MSVYVTIVKEKEAMNLTKGGGGAWKVLEGGNDVVIMSKNSLKNF